MQPNSTRRDFVRGIAVAGTVGALAGCMDGGGGMDGDGMGGDGDGMDGDDDSTPVAGDTVVAGPGGNFVFEPEELTVPVGETVTWEFDSPGHNVSARPDHSDEVEIPDDAEPFASYEGDDEFETVPEGETYEHTFEVAGTYRYVCVPHVAQGMIAQVVVEE